MFQSNTLRQRGLYLIGDRAPLAFYRFVNVVLQFITGLLAETDEGIKMLCLQWTARFPRSYGLSKLYDHMCDSEQLGAQLIHLCTKYGVRDSRPRGPSGLAIYLLAARPGRTGSAAGRAP